MFDDREIFGQWFGDSKPGAQGGDEWLETEKRVVVVHRLHQILEPFMLRRQVEDVEGSLPPKVCAQVLGAVQKAGKSGLHEWNAQAAADGALHAEPAAG